MTFPLTCLILDDEPASVTTLARLLADIPAIRVLGGCTTIREAGELLIREIPDVIFLDIQMPGQSGLEIMDEWRAKGISSEIVFVTGYDKYAIQAIRKAAADYLLKPVNPQELQDCLLRLRCRIQAKKEIQKAPSGRKIRFNTRSGCIYIDKDEIFYVRADVNYSHIHLTDQSRATVSMNLGSIEKMLEGSGFIRADRSLLINTDKIKRIENHPPRVFFTEPDNNLEIEISETALRSLKNQD